MPNETTLHPAAEVRDRGTEAPTRLSFAHRATAVFVSPARLFEELRSRPVWMDVLLLSVAVGILTIVLLPDQILYEGMQGATTRRGDPVAITSPPEAVARWERLRMSLGVAVTHPVKAMMLAGFLSFVFGRLWSGTATFWHYLAITTHAFLISALGALVVLPLQITRLDASIHASPTLLLGWSDPQSLLWRAAAATDLFTIWMIGVLAVGVAVANNRRSPGVPLVVLTGSYLAILLGIAMLGG